MLGLDRAAGILIVLILGGYGRLYGAFVGAPVYMVVRHFSSQWSPFYWMLLIGLLLIAVVMLGRGGLLGTARALIARLRKVQP